MIFFGFASEKHVGYFIQVLVLLFNQTSKHNTWTLVLFGLQNLFLSGDIAEKPIVNQW